MRKAGRLSLRTAATLGVLAVVAFTLSPLSSAQSGSAPDGAKPLVKMAQIRFGTLTEAELTMLRAAPTRKLAWASKSEDPDDPVQRYGQS